MQTGRNKKTATLFLTVVMLFSLLAGCSPAVPQEPEAEQMSGQIFLFGERHYVGEIQQKEIEIWSAYYNEYGMRDLFIEFPSYTAEYLNIWMQSEDDDILYDLYEAYNNFPTEFLDFFLQVKEKCPETVFHGTDTGLPDDAQGIAFLEYLTSTGQTDTEMYRMTQKRMEEGAPVYLTEESTEGKTAYTRSIDWAFREDMMTEYFIQEVEALNGANIMGIYGAAHVDVNETNYGSHEVPSMARQLQDKYGNDLHTRDLRILSIDDPYPGEPSPYEPSRTDTITIGGKTYTAQYLGKAAMSACYPEYQYREFWLLEGAYDDFKYKNLSYDNLLPHDNFPVEVKFNQVYAVDYTKTDGSVVREFYQSNRGVSYQEKLAAVSFEPAT